MEEGEGIKIVVRVSWFGFFGVGVEGVAGNFIVCNGIYYAI